MSSSSPPPLAQLRTGCPAPPHTLVPNTDRSEAYKFTPELQEIPRSYSIRDAQQMVWVLSGGVLIAAPSSSSVQPVTLTLIACRDTEFHNEDKGNLVFLGIKGKDLSFSCEEVEGQPTLQLKEVNIMELYAEAKARKPFLFFHSLEGSTSAFQSVSYPGWFIATSAIARQPITLTQERGLVNTNFYLDPEN